MVGEITRHEIAHSAEPDPSDLDLGWEAGRLRARVRQALDQAFSCYGERYVKFFCHRYTGSPMRPKCKSERELAGLNLYTDCHVVSARLRKTFCLSSAK